MEKEGRLPQNRVAGIPRRHHLGYLREGTRSHPDVIPPPLEIRSSLRNSNPARGEGALPAWVCFPHSRVPGSLANPVN